MYLKKNFPCRERKHCRLFNRNTPTPCVLLFGMPGTKPTALIELSECEQFPRHHQHQAKSGELPSIKIRVQQTAKYRLLLTCQPNTPMLVAKDAYPLPPYLNTPPFLLRLFHVFQLLLQCMLLYYVLSTKRTESLSDPKTAKKRRDLLRKSTR